jgi:hypothetical protein
MDAKSFGVKFDLMIRGLGAVVFALPETARFPDRFASPPLVAQMPFNFAAL